MNDPPREIDQFTFKQHGSADECYINVRADMNRVFLSVSLRENGDIDVELGPIEARRLIAALEKAASSVT